MYSNRSWKVVAEDGNLDNLNSNTVYEGMHGG